MIEFFKKAFDTRRHLLITAVWLFVLSFLISTFFSYRTSARRAKNQVENHLHDAQDAFHKVMADTALLYALHTGVFRSSEAPPVYNTPFGLFIYTLNDLGNPILTFWNDHTVEPLQTDVLRDDGSVLVHYQNGYFVLEKHTETIRNERLLVLALFPIKWDYFLENRYLRSEFTALQSASRIYDIAADTSGNVVRDVHGDKLFSLVQSDDKYVHRYDNFSIALWILGTFFLFFYLDAVAHRIYRQRGLVRAAGFLAAIIVLYRVVTILIPFPFNYKKLELFDPSIYASSAFLPSLGDLLMNSLLLFWLVVFVKKHFLQRRQLSFSVTEKQSWIINAAVAAILVLSVFIITDIVQSLVKDSQISFDVTNFFSLDIYTVVSFCILTVLMLTLYHASHVLLHLIGLVPPIDFVYRLLMVGVVGLLILVVSPFDTANSVNVLVLAWLIFYLFLLYKRKNDWSRPVIRSTVFVFWIMFFSISATSILVFQNKQTERAERRANAEKLAIQTDPSGETLLGIAMTNLSNRWLNNNFPRFYYEDVNKFMKDSLVTENFAGYLNKFDTRVYTYDSLFHSLHNEDSTSYATIKSLIMTHGKPTRTPGLYYYENTPDRFSYLFEAEVKNSEGEKKGYVFIVAKPKRYKSEALYPELFSESVAGSADLGSNYAYAIYSNGKLINAHNDLNFSRQLSPHQMPVLETEWREVNGRSELWYKAASNKVVVVVKTSSDVIEALTLFAYFFFSFLLIVLVVHAGGFLLDSRLMFTDLWRNVSISIRTQIHLTIIFISLFSFIVIGVATISFFIIRFDKNNQERLGRTIQVMANEIESRIAELTVFDDQLSIQDLGLTSELDKTIANVSDIHNVDVNFYDKQGNLRISTIPYLYNRGILNRKMHPLAYFEMVHNQRAEWLQQEKVGRFRYSSIYVPVKDENQETIAYLNIPYLNSQRELNEEISNFLVTLINLNALIFLLAGAIAFFFANKITSSFGLITAKMRQVNLGTVNEEIHWKNKDEIGALVNEYNTMVKKLEASANALAKSEREGAWREMARQVAHEIKNPLTPMKLSIQHLQRAIDNGAPNVKELSERMAATLIEQIDQLAKIAADFSQFANIGNIKPELVQLHQVLQSLIGLYGSDDRLRLHYQPRAMDAYIYADKTQINRLFTNLIKNAIEASRQDGPIHIFINLDRVGDRVQVAVRDEGSGIEEAMQQKIFSPNFTTKSSGTGLGLAICKAIVEKANGNIWFDTVEGSGTTFFVQFPAL